MPPNPRSAQRGARDVSRRVRIPRSQLWTPGIEGRARRPLPDLAEPTLGPLITFIPAIVEHAETLGRIGASNALNGCAASGVTPVAASVIVIRPQGTPERVERAIRDGVERVMQVETVPVVRAPEVEGRMGAMVALQVRGGGQRKRWPRAADRLWLSRDLGSHVLIEAFTRGSRTGEQTRAWLEAATRPDTLGPRDPRRVAVHLGESGLVGAAWALASGSGLDVVLDASRLPALNGVLEHLLAHPEFGRGSEFRRGFFAHRGASEGARRLVLLPDWAGGCLWASATEEAGFCIGELRPPRQDSPRVRLMSAFLP